MMKVWSWDVIEIISGVVQSEPLDSDTKLIFHPIMEIWENKTHIRFMFK